MTEAKSCQGSFYPCTEVKLLSQQGSTLRVNLWPQASKNSPKQLRASKKIPQLVLEAQYTFRDILVKMFPTKNVPKCF